MKQTLNTETPKQNSPKTAIICLLSNRGSCRSEVKHTWLEVSNVKQPAGSSEVTQSKMTHGKLCAVYSKHNRQDKERAKAIPINVFE